MRLLLVPVRIHSLYVEIVDRQTAPFGVNPWTIHSRGREAEGGSGFAAPAERAQDAQESEKKA